MDKTQAVWEGYQKIRDEKVLGPEGLDEKNRKLNESIAVWVEAYRERLVYARNPGENNLQKAEIELSKKESEQLKLRDAFFVHHMDSKQAAAEVSSELQKLLDKAGGTVDAKVKSHIESVIANLNDTSIQRTTLLNRFSEFNPEYSKIVNSVLRSAVINFALSGTVNTTPVRDLKLLDALTTNREAPLPAIENPDVSGLAEAIGSDIATKGATVMQDNDRIQQEFELIRTELKEWFDAEFPS